MHRILIMETGRRKAVLKGVGLQELQKVCYFIVILSWPQSSFHASHFPVSQFGSSPKSCYLLSLNHFPFFLKPTSVLCLSGSTEISSRSSVTSVSRPHPHLPTLPPTPDPWLLLFKTLFPGLQGTSGLSFCLLAGPPHLPDLLTVNRSSSITDTCSLLLTPLLILSSVSDTFY